MTWKECEDRTFKGYCSKTKPVMMCCFALKPASYECPNGYQSNDTE